MKEGQLLKSQPNLNGCQKCHKKIPADQRIGHDGMIVCGECFVHMQNIKTIQPEPLKRIEGPSTFPNETIIEFMTLLVDHEERLQALEKRLNKLDIQFDSICG